MRTCGLAIAALNTELRQRPRAITASEAARRIIDNTRALRSIPVFIGGAVLGRVTVVNCAPTAVLIEMGPFHADQLLQAYLGTPTAIPDTFTAIHLRSCDGRFTRATGGIGWIIRITAARRAGGKKESSKHGNP